MHRRMMKILSVLLLAGQSFAAGATAFAHASERASAPAAVEAEHGSACVVVHDPARCSGCQAVGLVGLPTATRVPVATSAGEPRPLVGPPDSSPSNVFRRAAAPRAPPHLSV